MQRIASVKSRNLGASISALHAEKPHNVAKTTPAASNLPYHKVSEKTTETSESKPKGPQNRNAGLTSVGPQVVRKANVGLTPKPGASLGSGASRSPASSRSHHFCIPVRSCYTVTSRARRSYDHGVFLYHLSQLEQTGFAKSAADPMKSVPAAELQLLHSGQRTTYLERRYARSPDDKYNYPEATSWRYGWFHRESDLLHKRVPRRD
ncbi:uncharacterized protein Dere_GG22972 [Drosophila erecta]|uniref:Sperm microtubule inner protein 1 C-terminal domain-containing protein n=2 Tax=Drosophila erecta TaxID=7220 RepID=B3NQL0_DROER|nr:uncharacterized protein Dere_GG22972 [Drosophila erecta]